MLRIVDITAPDINNGTGFRVTVWVAGCSIQCKGCHNKWMWDYNQGKIFIEESDDILYTLSDWLSKPYIEGITICGGDPLAQDSIALKELMQLIKWVRNNHPDKNIWLYTGYETDKFDPNNIIEKQKIEIVNAVDVVVDGPYIEELKSYECPFRGSSNQQIIKKENV